MGWLWLLLKLGFLSRYFIFVGFRFSRFLSLGLP
jgi:hypothetical protein